MEGKIQDHPGPPARAPLLWLVIPFLGGLAAAAAGLAGPLPLTAGIGLVAGLFSFGAACRARALWAGGIALALFAAGAISFALNRPPRTDSVSARPTPVRLQLRVERAGPPQAPRGRSRPAKGKPETGKTVSGFGRAIPGRRTEPWDGQRLYFSIRLKPGQDPPLRSAVVEVSGLLRPVPEHPPADSFFGYLAGLGIAFDLSPAWLKGELQPAAPYPRFCERLAARMSDLLGGGFERRPDLAAIYRAMMLGRKGDLTAGQKLLFIRSGTMHLFAINGLHIGIVALSVHALLALLRCPRLPGAAAVLAVLWLDVDSTGAAPSAVRAFLMIAVIEAGRTLDLPANPLAALAFAAAVSLGVAPLDFFGASFQMSFGVVLALITLGVPLSDRFAHPPSPERPPIRRRQPAPKPDRRIVATIFHHLLGAAAFGAAAAAVSAISGIEYFSTWAPVGLFANLLLMPLATLVIISGFAAIVSGLAHAFWITRLFNAAALLLLQAITAALRILVSLPGASFPAHYRADEIGPLALTAVSAACLFGYATRRRAAWLLPFLITTAVLLFAVRYN